MFLMFLGREGIFSGLAGVIYYSVIVKLLMFMDTSFVFFADGFEEIEAVTVVDVLRRGEMNVVTVSIKADKSVKGAHGMTVVTDKTIDEIDATDAQWLILPGGMPGATNLAACGKLSDMLKNQWLEQRGVAAICASPAVVLAPLGIVRGQQATCYPSFEAQLEKGGAVYMAGQRAVVSNNLITSDGPSSALDFALTIVAQTQGDDVASAVASGMLV